MGLIADPGECSQSTPLSFDEFQRQTSLMTSCTLLWKELSDHFTSLEQDLLKKSEALKTKLQTLDSETKHSLEALEKRESSISASISIALQKLSDNSKAALVELKSHGAESEGEGLEQPEVDNSAGLLLKLRSFCVQMDSRSFWSFVIVRKKELEVLRSEIPKALGDCVDPAKMVLEAISEVFPKDRREVKSDKSNDLGWACVLLLESLIPVMMDPLVGSERMLVTPSVREKANEIAETWKKSLDERGGIENVKTPDVHTFLQHLLTFGIVKKEDFDLYRKLVVGSAWRKQMPKLAVSLGLTDKMPEMIEELISRGQQLDAVHFSCEVGLVDKFPPVPLLKDFLKDAKKSAAAILEDPSNSGRAAHLAAKKELSAVRSVLKCIEEYKLEAEFPPENLKKRLEELEKSKTEKKKTAATTATAAPANKRTRVNNGGPMPPAKAGRSTNAYVSSFPSAPAFVRSPPHTQYPVGVPAYPTSPAMYVHGGSRSPPYVYSPEAAPYPGSPYSPYGGYSNAVSPAYHQAYY
ncbi:PREDICTED: FRIGIDA-like protein 4a [Ipomoea nil]|uniref:FRIGIDA-like protein 4a n=1 Tax=Ipomoea nil TaxID=35883 RepID=UPI000900EC57|nr:PREDICTED: FRIGIDA-like protein 4a [Ipomoea nil]